MVSEFEPPFFALTSIGCGICGKHPKRFIMGLKTVGTAAVSSAIVLMKLSSTVMMITKTFI